MAGPRYIAEATEQLKPVELDGLTAVFHRRSGLTHIVAAPAPQILEVLRQPGDVDAILARLVHQFDVTAEGDTRAAMETRLTELQAAGLVSRA